MKKRIARSEAFKIIILFLYKLFPKKEGLSGLSVGPAALIFIIT